jgi:hypothetical protein
MSRSSIFSFRTYRVPLGSLAVLGALILGSAAGVDLIWRVWRPLDTADGWFNRNLGSKMEGMLDLAREKGRVDVLLVSTSVTKAVDVEQWELACNNKIVAWNAAVPGLRPHQTFYLIKGLLRPRTGVSHVIQGITPRDITSRGGLQQWSHRKHGHFFDSWKMRRAAAETGKERLKTSLVSLSSLAQDRRVIRAWIQGGLAVTDELWYSTNRGMAPPGLMRLPDVFPENYLSWIKQVPDLNAVHQFHVPEDGEFGMILELNRYCRENGMEHVVVSYPWSQGGHVVYDNPAEDHARYLAVLDNLRARGVPVYDLDSTLKLPNSMFEDAWHDNRWGGEESSSWMYRHIIRKWFPDRATAPDIPRSRAVHLDQAAPTGTCRPEYLRIPVSDPLQERYEGDRQTRLPAGCGLVLQEEAGPGLWTVDVYGGDLSRPKEDTIGGHVGLDAGKGVVDRSRNHGWGRTLQHHAYARLRVRLESTATLTLKAEEGSALLDTAFLIHNP